MAATELEDLDADDDGQDEEDGRGRRPAKRARPTWIAAGVLAAVAVALAAALALRAPGAGDRRRQVVDLSDRFSVALGSYDYHHLAQDVAAVKALATGGFQGQYQAVLGAQDFQQTLVTNQSVSKAQVTAGPFVASLSADQADTYTLISQTLTGKDTPKPVTRSTRVELDLVHTTAGWKVDQVNITGQ